MNQKSKTKKTFGWFEFSEAPIGIRNFKSDQSLAVTKTEKTCGGNLLSCEYKDQQLDIDFKLLFPIAEKGKWQTIELDYKFAFDEPPSYGLWRRLDDFLSDAIRCWPTFLFEFKSFRLRILGGYVNSKYCATFEREFNVRGINSNISMHDYIVANPVIHSLDIPTPLIWHYRDVHFNSAKIDFSFENIPDTNARRLVLTDNLDKFQSFVPYLEREDQNAYIFPCNIHESISGGPDPSAAIYIKYIFINENQ